MIGFRKGVKILKKLCLGIFKIVIYLKSMMGIFRNNLGNIHLISLQPKGNIRLELKMKMIVRCGCPLFDT